MPAHFSCNPAGDKQQDKNMNKTTTAVAMLVVVCSVPLDAPASGDTKKVKGFVGTLNVNIRAIQLHRPAIKEVFNQMTSGLDTPEGITLFNAGITRDGRVWLDELTALDALIALGIAAEIIEFVEPREQWPANKGEWSEKVHIRYTDKGDGQR